MIVERPSDPPDIDHDSPHFRAMLARLCHVIAGRLSAVGNDLMAPGCECVPWADGWDFARQLRDMEKGSAQLQREVSRMIRPKGEDAVRTAWGEV